MRYGLPNVVAGICERDTLRAVARTGRTNEAVAKQAFRAALKERVTRRGGKAERGEEMGMPWELVWHWLLDRWTGSTLFDEEMDQRMVAAVEADTKAGYGRGVRLGPVKVETP